MFTKVKKYWPLKLLHVKGVKRYKLLFFSLKKLLFKVEMPINFNLGLRTAYKLQIDRCHKIIVMESRM